MMMVLVIGGSMALAMSCVGGLAGWYLYDDTLGGLLSEKGDGSGSGDDDDEDEKDAPEAGGSIPLNKAVYIFNKGCKDTKGYSLLSVYTPKANELAHMQCNPKMNSKWVITKAKDKYYYIRPQGTNLYLTFSVDAPNYSLHDGDSETTTPNPKPKGPALSEKMSGSNLKKQQWYIGKHKNGGYTLTVSKSISSIFKNHRYMSITETLCKKNINWKQNNANLYYWTDGKGAGAEWQFKPSGTSGSVYASCS